MFRTTDLGNERALEIKNYIETEAQKLRTSRPSTSTSLSDELQKLAALRAQGILSDSEFNAAKKRLLGDVESGQVPTLMASRLGGF